MALRHILPGAGKPGVMVERYSIVRVGREYVVRADEKSILKIASRRRAARLISEAAELLESQSVSVTVAAASAPINRA